MGHSTLRLKTYQKTNYATDHEVEKSYIPLPSIERYISKLVNISKIDPRIERIALNLAQK